MTRASPATPFRPVSLLARLFGPGEAAQRPPSVTLRVSTLSRNGQWVSDHIITLPGDTPLATLHRTLRAHLPEGHSPISLALPDPTT